MTFGNKDAFVQKLFYLFSFLLIPSKAAAEMSGKEWNFDNTGDIIINDDTIILRENVDVDGIIFIEQGGKLVLEDKGKYF